MEAHHFEIRKTLLDYDNVMNQQREVIYTLRREFMVEEDLDPVLDEFLNNILDEAYAPLETAAPDALDETRATVLSRLRDVFNLDRVLASDAQLPDREETYTLVMGIISELREAAGESFRDIERYFLLEELDRCWKEHLRNMDALRDGIGLRGFGQRDPKLEYKREGFDMFQAMLFQIREAVFRALTRVRVQVMSPEEEEARAEAERAAMAEEFRHHDDNRSLSYSASGQVEAEKPKPAKAAPRVGRNDPCPCGSGKKYKKCCGRAVA